MTLSTEEREALRTAAAALIPADAPLGMPAADDALILADIERSIGRDLDLVRAALASPLTGDINDWYAKGGMASRTLGRIVLAAYYRDDRVLRALGHEARPPFPKGYEVEQGDWGLLEAVKQRSSFWRKDA